MRRSRDVVLHVLLPLAVGAAIYAGWRDQTLLGWRWAEALGAGDVAGAIRGALRAAASGLPSWVVYTLPDALWVYALAWSLGRLHLRAPRSERALAVAVPIAMGPGAELAQLVGWLPGTFDVLDVFATAAALGATVATCGGLRAGSRRAVVSGEGLRAVESG